MEPEAKEPFKRWTQDGDDGAWKRNSSPAEIKAEEKARSKAKAKAYDSDSYDDDEYSSDSDEDLLDDAIVPDVVGLPLALREPRPVSSLATAGVDANSWAYADEQTHARFRVAEGGMQQWAKHADTPNADIGNVKTRYLTPKQQRKHELNVDDKGSIRDASGGLADTTGASGTGTLNQEAQGKHIFTMSPEGTIRAIDPWANKTETPMAGGQTEMSFINHTSLSAEVSNMALSSRSYAQGATLLQSGEVAGAGELMMQQGKLQQISDASGHYKPNNQLTGQVVDTLDESGVDLHDTSLKLTPKAKSKDPHRDRNLHASVREFQEVRAQQNKGAIPNAKTPEEIMRDRREALREGIASRANVGKAEVGADARTRRFPKQEPKPAAESGWGDWFDGLTTGASDLWSQTQSTASSVADTVGTGMTSIGSSISSGVSAAWDWAAGGLSGLFGGNKGTAEPRLDADSTPIDEVFEGYSG